MRKLLSLLFAAMLSTQAWADHYDFSAVCSSGHILYYQITDIKEKEVSLVNPGDQNYSSRIIGNVIIPETVTEPRSNETLTVTSIGEMAFSLCRGLTSVSIPNSVTSIGREVFYGCASLTSIDLPFVGNKPHQPTDDNQFPFGFIFGSKSYSGCIPARQSFYSSNTNSFATLVCYIPSSLKTITITGNSHIPNGAFSDCMGLTSVTISNSVTSIGNHAFYNCSGLTSVTIPNSVTSIGDHAFYGCSGLTSVTIPNMVTSIGDYAFYGCGGLTTVTIPNSVTSIGKLAFYNCSGLISVTIPNSVTSIGDGAFSDCVNLVDINVERTSSAYVSENGILFNKDKTIIVCYPSGKTETTYTIPQGVTSVGDFAFSGCGGLTEITIPNSVTSIGKYAFYGCSSLTSVTIPNSVTRIGDYTFGGCDGLTSVTIPNSVTSIGNSAFYKCSCLTSVTIPNSVTSIGDFAFYNCSGLTSVTISNSVKIIGSYAFYDCSGLTSVTIPNSVTTIGSYAFYDCSGLTSVTIPNSVITIGSYAFYDCSGLTSVTIPNSVKYIESETFRGCSGLTSITIPNSVTSLGRGAFYDCSGLTSVTIPNSIKYIESETFRGCSGLTSVTIPNSVTSLGWGAFYDCGGLTSVTIPNSVTSIGNYAFNDCYQMNAIIPSTVQTIGEQAFLNVKTIAYTGDITGSPWGAKNVGAAYDEDGFIYADEEKTNLIGYAGNAQNITIPNTVRTIGADAFSGYSNLIITIPNRVGNIGENAFLNAKAVIYSGNATGGPWGAKIVGAAYDKDSLIYGNTNRTSLIGYIGNAQSITIPKTVTNISPYAFSGCSNMIIEIPNRVRNIGENAFLNVKAIIYTGNATGSPWGAGIVGTAYDKYGFIYGDTDKTILIGYVGNAQSITIPKTVTTIDPYAFSGCSDMTIKIPNRVRNIGENAFLNVKTIIYTGNANGSPWGARNIGIASDEEGFIYADAEETELVGYIGNATSITIPNSVISIAEGTFLYCSSLTSITILNSVTSIGDDAFGNCLNLTEINVESDNTMYTSQDGVLFNKRKTTIICYPEGKAETSYTIPNTVTSIGNYAFSGCSGLTSVIIPRGVVTSIGNHAFSDCSGLTSVSIPKSVKSIGNSAFADCSGLTSISISNSVTSIGDYAFKGCSGLTSVTIPNSVTSIGDYAFEDCSNVTLYCEVEESSKPSGWNSNWNYSSCPVKWGCWVVSAPPYMAYVEPTITGENYELIDDYGALWFLNDAIEPSVTITFNVYGGHHWHEGKNRYTRTPYIINEPVTASKIYISGHEAIDCEADAEPVLDAAVAPTCTEPGLTAGRHCSLCGYIFVAQEILPINSSNHNYGTPTYAWSEDGSTCTATAVCQHNANHKETEDATITSEEAIAATCEEMGTTTYTASFINNRFSKQTKDVVDIVALGHNFGAPTYTWSEDGSTCTATAVCQRDANHKETEDATITNEETIAATCEEMGTTTYTASFTNSRFSTQTKDVVDIPALGHNFGAPTYTWSEDGSTCTATAVCQRDANHKETEDATITKEETVAATCEEMGTTTYTASFTNDRFSKQTKDVVDIAALGHNFGAPTYVWSEDGSTCTATAVCQRDANHKETEDATITDEETIAATCEEMGTTTYTASFTNSRFSKQTKDVVDIAALGHNFGAPTYAWSEDGSTCTATAVCQRDANHKETEDATITDEETIAATCEKMGTTTYTASFTNSRFSKQTKDVVDIAALDHNFGAPTYAWSEDGSTCTQQPFANAMPITRKLKMRP